MRYFILALLFAISIKAICAQPVSKQKSDTTSHINAQSMIMHSNGNAPWLYPYEPSTIKSLEELPVGSVSKIEGYMRERVGENYYKTLKFAGGQKVNLTSTDSAKLGVKDYRWKLATYYLRFICTTTKVPGGCFEAGASFDSSGSVIDSINLPSQTNQFDKFELIPPARAIKIAKTKWPITKGRSWINDKTIFLDCSPLNTSFVWWFSKSTSRTPGKSHLRRIFIDANTGDVLRIRDNTRRYIPF